MDKKESKYINAITGTIILVAIVIIICVVTYMYVNSLV